MDTTAWARRTLPLTRWVISPHPPEGIYSILEAISDEDLMMCFAHLTGATARIAWAEYGRRKGHVDFEVRVAVMNGQLQLSFEGEAKPIHDGPALSVLLGPN